MLDCWKRFRSGDKVSDEELEKMIQDTEEAIEYCTDRGLEFGVVTRVLALDLASLKDTKFHRDFNKR